MYNSFQVFLCFIRKEGSEKVVFLKRHGSFKVWAVFLFLNITTPEKMCF